jgi:hypothetical protein
MYSKAAMKVPWIEGKRSRRIMTHLLENIAGMR